MPWKIPERIPPPEVFTGFDPTSPVPPAEFTHYDRHLPHWRLPGACYFTTFRLGDSLPAAVLAEMQREEKEWQMRLAEETAKNGGRLSPQLARAWQDFRRTGLRKLEGLLDLGLGSCLLREPSHRLIVEEALRHFEGERCQMLAYAVMPNHVHALCRPLADHRIEKLCGAWKWFTAQKIQHAVGGKGAIWQEENFDRIIRDAAHYSTTVRYIAKNPLKAGLSESEASVWFCQGIRQANGWQEE